MEKSFVYKQYSSNEFVGVLPNVVSEFFISKEINTSGSEIEVVLGISLQEANASVTTSLLVDESGNYIVTENGERVVLSREPNIELIPSVNDRIEVWEYSERYPSGIRVFNGFVSKWSSNLVDNITTLTLISLGVKLDHHLIQIFPEESATSNLFEDTFEIVYPPDKSPNNRITKLGQTFTVGADVEVSKIKLWIDADDDGGGGPSDPNNPSIPAILRVYNGTPTSPGSLVATVSRNITDEDDFSEVSFIFSTPISLTQSTQYYFEIENGWFGATISKRLDVGYDTGNNYGGGAMYEYNDLSGWSATSNDLYFDVITSSGGIGNVFNSYDPSDIARELIDTYESLDQGATYTSSTIEDTDTEVSYTFKFNTFLEGLKKVIQLSPSRWWWWLDPATGLFYMKPLPQTVDHTFILGKHITKFDISESIEAVINTVYFTGGEVSGENIQVNYSDATSIDDYGTWLDRPTDNRVTTGATADLIAENIVNSNRLSRYITRVEVHDNDYDINSILIGELVGFANSNEFVDSLKLQVVGMNRKPDTVELILDKLPPTQSKRIEDIKRNLKAKESENNPST